MGSDGREDYGKGLMEQQDLAREEGSRKNKTILCLAIGIILAIAPPSHAEQLLAENL